MNRPRQGAKAVTWDYNILDLFDDRATRCYKLTDRQVAALMTTLTQMEWRTRWFNAPDSFQPDEWAGRLAHQLSQGTRCTGELPDGVTINEHGELEICDIMVVINVYEGCCGDQTHDAGAFSGGAGDSTGGSIEFPPVAQIPADCYKIKAVDYLLGRAERFTLLLNDIANLGFDAVFATIDEVFDAAFIISSIVTGQVDLNTVKEFTEANIRSAFANATFRSVMYNAWTYEGRINRAQLAAWVSRAPVIVEPLFQMQANLLAWVGASIIPGYNDQLAILAQSCASGIEIPEPTATVDPVQSLGSLVDGTDQYDLYQLIDITTARDETDDRTLTQTIATIDTQPGDIVALIGQIEFVDPIPVNAAGERKPWMDILRSKNVSLDLDDGTAIYGFGNRPEFQPPTDQAGWSRWTVTTDLSNTTVLDLAETVRPVGMQTSQVDVDIEGFNIGNDLGTNFLIKLGWAYIAVGARVRTKAWIIVKSTA